MDQEEAWHGVLLYYVGISLMLSLKKKIFYATAILWKELRAGISGGCCSRVTNSRCHNVKPPMLELELWVKQPLQLEKPFFLNAVVLVQGTSGFLSVCLYFWYKLKCFKPEISGGARWKIVFFFFVKRHTSSSNYSDIPPIVVMPKYRYSSLARQHRWHQHRCHCHLSSLWRNCIAQWCWRLFLLPLEAAKKKFVNQTRGSVNSLFHAFLINSALCFMYYLLILLLLLLLDFL